MFPIKIRRNLKYETGNEAPRYFFEVDLNEVVANRSAMLPVYWRLNRSHPILKEIYFTEIGGFRIEKGNLAALADAVPQAIETLVDHNTLPYYSISLPNGSKIPIYLADGKLQTKIGSVQIEGSDIGEVYRKLSKHLISSKIVKNRNDIIVNIFLWRDLKLYPPAFIFRDDKDRIWIPIFCHEKDELNYDIINQPSRILRMEELFDLRKEIITSLISTKAISPPYSIFMDQVRDEVWKELRKMVKPLDQCFICDTTASQKFEISVYEITNELIAANRPKIYFGKDFEQLRSQVAEDMKKEGLIHNSTSLKIEKKRRR